MWVRTSRLSTLVLDAVLLSSLFILFACGGGGGGNGGGGGGGGVTPTVVTASPGNGATQVGTNADIFATFSTAMDASTINTSTFTVSGGVVGTVTYDATHLVAKFHPNGSLAQNTAYTVTISTGAKSSGGRALLGTYTWSFTTAGNDTTAPTVSDTTPGQDATNVALNTVIKITFSEPMDPLSFPQQIIIPVDATHNVALTVKWNPTGTQLSLTPPSTGLPAGTYAIDIIGYTDAAGNVMVPFTLHFSTVS